MSSAPVCHLPVVAPIDQPTSPTMEAVPLATDLESLIAAVNALRRNFLRQQQGNDGYQGFDGSQGGIGPAGQRGQAGRDLTPNNQKSQWSEPPGSRVTETVRIYQNNDKTSPNYVDVERINKLTMVDRITKHKWTFTRTGG